MKKISQSKRVERDRQLLAALAKHFGKNDVFVVNGEKMKYAEMLAILEERIRVAEPVAPAKAQWIACRALLESLEAKTDPTVAGFLAFLQLVHAGAPQLLAEFGLAPKPARRRRSKRASGQTPAPAPAPIANGTNGTAVH